MLSYSMLLITTLELAVWLCLTQRVRSLSPAFPRCGGPHMSPSEQWPKRQPSPSRSPSSDCGPRANQPTPSDNTERLLLIGSDNYLKQTAPLNRGQSSEHVYTLLGKLPQSPSLPVCFSLSLRLMHTHKHTHTDTHTGVFTNGEHTHTHTLTLT